MLDDIGCWAILAAMIAFITCGCILTRSDQAAVHGHDAAA